MCLGVVRQLDKTLSGKVTNYAARRELGHSLHVFITGNFSFPKPVIIFISQRDVDNGHLSLVSIAIRFFRESSHL